MYYLLRDKREEACYVIDHSALGPKESDRAWLTLITSSKLGNKRWYRLHIEPRAGFAPSVHIKWDRADKIPGSTFLKLEKITESQYETYRLFGLGFIRSFFPEPPQ